MKWPTFALVRHHLKMLFVSPGAWIGFSAALFLSGFFFFNLLALFNSELVRYQLMAVRLPTQRPDVYDWVIGGYFRTLVVLIIFFVPSLAVRFFTEEARGSLSLLLSLPLSTWQIVAGKFLATTFAVLLALAILGVFPVGLGLYAGLPLAPVWVGLCGVAAFAIAIVGIAVACVLLVGSPSLGAAVAMGVALLLYVAHAPAEALGPAMGRCLVYLSSGRQIEQWLQGSIEGGSLVYFVSLTVMGLLIGWGALELRRSKRGMLVG